MRQEDTTTATTEEKKTAPEKSDETSRMRVSLAITFVGATYIYVYTRVQ